ncbi:Arc family DNA-binding protein [Thiothrix sp.]|uniref:Arc family DNA-binding protein n=1 Tax=Thiothrix sp. TaxID=1032 RepID=UPI00338D6956
MKHGDTAQHTIRLPPDLMDWISARAKRSGRSTNREITLLLFHWKKLEDSRNERAAARTAAQVT